MSCKHLQAFRRAPGAVWALALLATLAIAGIVAGCGSKPNAPVRPVPLTLVAQGVGGAAHRYPAASATFLASAGAASDTIPVTFTRALLVVRDVRFILSDADGDDEGGESDTLDVGDDDADEDAGQVRFHGPFVIDLLSHTAARLDTMMVLPGDYARVQGHLQALHDGDPDAPAFPELIGSTVLLEGTIGGDGGGPFTYLARIDDEFQIRGGFNVAADTPATAFVTFDLSTWLQGHDGQFLDPRVLDNDAAIKSAIRHSIKVGMDDDHDGEIDDEMHVVVGP